MELISVIIPVYNTKKYLRKCIESVLAQTYKHIEVILVDDESTDGSQDICDEYAEKDIRVRAFHKKNGGAASSRNMGLDVSKGDYIYFVDCDDYIDGNALEILLKCLNKTNADMAVSNYVFVNEKGEELLDEENAIRWSECLISGKQFLARNCIEGKKPAVAVWNKLYRKKIFNTLRYDEGKLHEDVQVFHLVCERCDLVAVIGKVLYFNTKREDSIMGKYDYSRGTDIFESYLKRIIYMKETREPELQLSIKSVINMFFYMAFLYSCSLGFDNEILNMQMRSIRKEVWKFIPIFWGDTSRTIRERIACIIWLFSPKIYGKIWGKKHEAR